VIFDAESAQRDLAALAARHARPSTPPGAEVPAELDRAIAADGALAGAAARARRGLVEQITARLDGLVDPSDVARFGPALLAVPRERFVAPEEIARSAEDAPSPLDAEGLATVSAPHAYVLTYALLDLGEGDHLIELGTGTGYGAALASHVVGRRGRVTSIEIDPALHVRARRILAAPHARGPARIALLLGDARAHAPEALAQAAAEARPVRIAVTYALPSAPDALLDLLPEGGRLVAPVGARDQLLRRWTREPLSRALSETVHGAVRYVAERS